MYCSPIGNLPTAGALDLSGLNLPANYLKQLLAVDLAGWKTEIEDVAASYATLGGHLPKALNDQLDSLRKRLG